MDTDATAIEMATALTIAWLSNAHTRTTGDEVPAFLATMHEAVTKLAAPVAEPQDEPSREYKPAVSARKSLASPDHIISMIDGKQYKALRRHLKTNGLTPEEYRQRYGLRSDYPMVAASYSEVRRAMAKKVGLGRKPGQKVEKAAASVAKKTRRTTAPSTDR